MSTPTNVDNYFTISHCDTHEPLGMKGRDSRHKTLNVLLFRRVARVNGRDVPFRLHEWYVTEWQGDGSDDDTIIAQASAEEFVAARGHIAA